MTSFLCCDIRRALWHVSCWLQVDASLAKGVQRITGSVLGCIYGFLVMLSPAVATNPYAVTAFACLSAFVCGLYAQHRFNYGAFLALYTSAVVLLAQVSPSASHRCTPHDRGWLDHIAWDLETSALCDRRWIVDRPASRS